MSIILSVEIVAAMFVAGLFLGFVGAGGSGFIISILTAVFGFPIHMALGTALAAMLFSSASGTMSHYREGNIALKTGTAVGLFGAAGAWACSLLAVHIAEHRLQLMTAGMLYFSALVLWARIFLVQRSGTQAGEVRTIAGASFWLRALIIGLVCGALSGLFGVGSTPFIQIGLMMVMGMPVRQAAGTTMLVIIPIALAGGIGFYGSGNLDMIVLLEVLVGIMAGSYIGAKFTKRVPSAYLKTAMVAVPLLGATLLLFKS